MANESKTAWKRGSRRAPQELRFSQRSQPRSNRILLTPSKLRPASKLPLLGLSIALILSGAFLPTQWYEALPRPADAPPRPFDGSILLRLAFLAEGVLTGLIALTGWRPAVYRETSSPDWLAHIAEADDLPRGHAVVLLAFVTGLGLFLRFYRVGLDLWLDEIATVQVFAARPLLEIFGSYTSAGNHLLNSLLTRMSSSVFGISEWSVRLPAVLFGIATIPAMYYVARLAMSRAASVGAALLLAVSYHHIWFSQDTKGYSSYLFFVLVGSALLASVIRRDSLAKWVAYIVSMALALASLMTTVFALAGHVIVGAIAMVLRRRRGLPVRPLAERLALAFAAVGVLGFQIYALSIPDVIAIYPTVYNITGAGYVFFSREFFAEIARGMSAGFAFGLAAIPLLAIGAAGFIVLLRRSWPVALSLLLSVGVTVLYLLLRGQTISPRLLLPGLPLAILSCMATVDAIARSGRLPRFFARFSSRALTLGASVLFAAVSALALPSYYSAPKQPYRQAIHYLERTKGEDDRVIAVFPVAGGLKYYLGREGVTDLSPYRFVETMAAYDSAVQNRLSASDVLVTSLFRVLRSTTPPLAEVIERDWEPVRGFRGTLGDGSITLWRKRTGSPPP